MSQHTPHAVFDGFQTLWVFNPKKKFPLGLNELLVYSALAHADRREQQPKNTDLAWRTGLSRNTIPKLLTKLFNESLIQEDRTPLNRPDLFFVADRKGTPQHWSERLRFWKCLVRCEGSKLLVSDQCVLSYVWWSQINGFNPANGWSVPYLASVLKCTKKTVEDALGRLTKMSLLKVSNKQWCVPTHLKPLQEEWLIARNTDMPVKEKVTLGEFEPDMRQLASEYIPGEVMAPDSVIIPDTTLDLNVEWLKVTDYLKPLLKTHQLSEGARHRIIQAARRDLDSVGTAGNEWKVVVDLHVERFLA